MAYREFILMILLVGAVYTKVSFKEKVKVAQYGLAFLDCNTKGQDFSWIKNNSNKRIRAKPGKYTIFLNGTLKIEKITLLDVGVYNCRIAGPIKSNVMFKLEINTETINASVQTNVKLTCKAKVPQKQRITTAIYRFYVLANTSQKLLLSENGKLTEHGKEFGKGKLKVTKKELQINKIEKGNQGKFLCTVVWKSENHKGLSEYFFNVKVYGESTKSPPLTNNDDRHEAGEENNINSSGGKIRKNIWYLTALMAIVALHAFKVK